MNFSGMVGWLECLRDVTERGAPGRDPGFIICDRDVRPVIE